MCPFGGYAVLDNKCTTAFYFELGGFSTTDSQIPVMQIWYMYIRTGMATHVYSLHSREFKNLNEESVIH